MIVDPITAAAARGGGIDIDVAGETTLRGQIVGTLRAVPDRGHAVRRDRPASALQRTLDADSPGSGTPGEIWLGGGGRVDPGVRAAPYNRLVLQVRADAEARLVADPLARGAAALLLLAALAAAAVAVVAVALVVRSDLSSGADDLLTLEADGATPASLRRLLAIRTGLAGAARDRAGRGLRRDPDARRDAAGGGDGHGRRSRPAPDGGGVGGGRRRRRPRRRRGRAAGRRASRRCSRCAQPLPPRPAGAGS